MSDFYASPNTLVLQHKALPDDFPEALPTYDRSGWCTMEQAAASLASVDGGSLYEIGRGKVFLSANERLRPEQMAAKFRDESKIAFVGKGDRDVVAQQYKRLYERVTGWEAAQKGVFSQVADNFVLYVCGGPFAATILFGLVAIASMACSIWFFTMGRMQDPIIPEVLGLGVFTWFIIGSLALRRYWRWMVSSRCSTSSTRVHISTQNPAPNSSSAPGPNLRSQALLSSSDATLKPTPGVWRGYVCGVWTGDEYKLTAEGERTKVEQQRGRATLFHLQKPWYMENSSDGKGLLRDGRQMGARLVDAFHISLPASVRRGHDVGWSWHSGDLSGKEGQGTSEPKEANGPSSIAAVTKDRAAQPAQTAGPVRHDLCYADARERGAMISTEDHLRDVAGCLTIRQGSHGLCACVPGMPIGLINVSRCGETTVCVPASCVCGIPCLPGMYFYEGDGEWREPTPATGEEFRIVHLGDGTSAFFHFPGTNLWYPFQCATVNPAQRPQVIWTPLMADSRHDAAPPTPVPQMLHRQQSQASDAKAERAQIDHDLGQAQGRRGLVDA